MGGHARPPNISDGPTEIGPSFSEHQAHGASDRGAEQAML